jgi:peptidoglycan hydrolase-like protein with peptidoglycan-binding domain
VTDKTKNNRRLRQILLGIVAGMALLVATMSHLGAQSQGSGTPDQQAAALDPSERDSLVSISGAIGLTLEGVIDPTLTAPVRFATRAAMPQPDAAILEGGFHLVSSTAAPFAKAQGEESARTAEGVLLHRDRFGRYISTGYTANYRTTPEGAITVHRTIVMPIDAPVPKISVYIVPAARVIPAHLKTQPFTRLLEYMAAKAVSRIKTPKVDRGEKDYYVFAFFMDRLAEDARVGLLISNQPGGITGQGRDTQTLQKNGWHMAYTPARCALDGTPETFFKVLYTPGSRVPEEKRKQMLVGIFGSDSLVRQTQRLLAKRGYNPGPADGMMGSRTRKAIRQFQQDRKMKVDGEPGVLLLAALNTPDQPGTRVKTTMPSTPDPDLVRRIQLGLAQRGYDPGPADGVLEQRTQQAIMAFQRDQGLKADGKPSAELAARLTGSGRQAGTARKQFKSKMWPNLIRRP